MFDSRRFHRVVSALLAVAAALGVLGVVSPTAEGAPRKLDHFRCYPIIATGTFPPELVYLDDQFTKATEPPEPATVVKAEWFCNPTEKWHNRRRTAISNRDGHLTFYSIDTFDHAPTRWVKYSNQFRTSWLEIGDALWLAVPTQKQTLSPSPLPGETHNPPTGLDHFKCYEVITGRPASKSVRLKDQWTRPPTSVSQQPIVKVYDPIMFCNPTEKIHPNAPAGFDPVSEITNPRGHLVCYRTDPGPPNKDASGAAIPYQAIIHNQIQPDADVLANPADVLCVPSTKLKWFEVEDTDDPAVAGV